MLIYVWYNIKIHRTTQNTLEYYPGSPIFKYVPVFYSREWHTGKGMGMKGNTLLQVKLHI